MTISFSYIVDALGNLVRLDLSRNNDALIRHASELVSTASDLKHPKPWTVTISKAIDQVRFLPFQMVVGTPAELIHTKGVIPVSPCIFVAPIAEPVDKNEIDELVKLYDQLEAQHSGRLEIEKALSEVGVVKCPEGITVRPTPPGFSATIWLSHSMVYSSASFGSGDHV